MPFTPSHIAAVLPLRRRLPLVPLAIGAMIPDFGYYLSPCRYFSDPTHSLGRLFTFSLPIGLLVLVFLALTARGWRRLDPKFDARVAAVAIPAIVIGAMTHLFWDAWTHADGYFVRLVPGLPYHVLQHGSTVVGGVVVLAAWRPRWNARQFAFLAATLFAAAMATWAGLHPGDPAALSDRRWYFLLITAFFGNWILVAATVVVGLCVL